MTPHHVPQHTAATPQPAVHVSAGLVQRVRLSRTALWMFVIFAALLPLPFLRFPMVGLSVAAPLLLLVALEVFVGRSGLVLRPFRKWIAFAYLVWMAWLISLLGNALLGRVSSLQGGDFVLLGYWAYWMLVFIVSVIVTATTDIFRRLSIALGVSVIILGVARVTEGVIYSNWGGAKIGGDIILTSQNLYGELFSQFSPFALLLPFFLTGWKRLLSFAGVVVLVLAILGNGSRGSWISVVVGGLTFFIMYWITQRGGSGKLVLVLLVAVLLASAIDFLPPSVTEAIELRISTLQRLEEDKSLLFRQLMMQKGLALFEESPLIGVGPARFKEAYWHLGFPSGTAHNSYMLVVAETGLLGAVPFAILLFTLAVGGFRATSHHARRGEIWAIAVYASFVGLSVHFWVIAGITSSAPWFAYGIVAGLIMRSAFLQTSSATA